MSLTINRRIAIFPRLFWTVMGRVLSRATRVTLALDNHATPAAHAARLTGTGAEPALNETTADFPLSRAVHDPTAA